MKRGTSRRAGAIGAAMGGNSRRAATKRNTWALIKAKDLITVHQRGIHSMNSNVLDVCKIATESPSLLHERQKKMIWAVWQDMAEAQKLHGIRNAATTDGATLCSAPVES
ncbi:MAG: hypothetical protein GY820_39850 [Gammaproteobacteria bacterium]|nr:hypothetical protein [Gammaproteobacteria bacterium]